MARYLLITIFLLLSAGSASAATWWVRTDGAASPTCTGQTNASSASSPNCAFANPQEAINAAALGDTINLRAGDVFTGNFNLPLKAGSAYLTIQSTRANELQEGSRVSPSQVALFSALRSNTVEPVIATAALAAVHHYKFIGIEFDGNISGIFNIIRLGDSNQTSLSQVPNEIIIDRCYVHGRPTFNSQRGILLNSASTTISNSYVSDIHWVGVDTQAVAGWNGPGPFTITNNYLEGGGENIIFGGAVPAITNLIPSDIVISGNYLFKPLSWRVGDPSYAGIPWTVKNLLELKSARRVTITYNTLENSWVDAQIGWGVNFNSSTEDSGTWNVIEDVTFRRNNVINCANGIVIAGGNKLSVASTEIKLRRLTIEDNYLNVGQLNGAGRTIQLGQGSEDVTFNHNTVTGAPVSMYMSSDLPTLRHIRPLILNNLSDFGDFGLFGDGGFIGTACLNQYATDWSFLKNALYDITPSGFNPSQFPPDNYFPPDLVSSIGLLGTDGYPVGVRPDATTRRLSGKVRISGKVR